MHGASLLAAVLAGAEELGAIDPRRRPDRIEPVARCRPCLRRRSGRGDLGEHPNQFLDLLRSEDPVRAYETFGDEIANELVEWFNSVDATYRADLRELNELNFARFDAKVQQRFAEFELKIEQRFADVELRIEQRFADFERRFADFEQRFAAFEVKVEQRFAASNTTVERRLAELETSLARVRADLIKWSFVFWLGMVVTVFVAKFL